MKDTGVPALGAVPEHWQVRRLASLGRLFKGNGGSKEDDCAEGVPCVRYGDLYTTHTFHITRSRGFIPHEKVSEYTPIRYGDVLFAASGETIDEIGKSAVNLIESAACCGGDVVVFRPQFEVNARFLGYATDCRPAAVQKARMGRGITVKHIYDSELRNLVVALPPLDEQAAIVRFLDHADRRIRQYIRAKKKLIALLNEQKQAVLEAVLASAASGSSNRLRVRLKHIAVIQTGITLGKNYGKTPLIERPYLRVANVQAGRIDLSRIKTVRVPEAEAQRSTLLPGDVLMTEGGDRDKLGRGCVWNGEIPDCLHQNHIFAVRPDSRLLLPRFLVACMASRAGRDYFEMTAKQTTNLAATNSATVGNLPLVLPPVDLQAALLKRIEERLENAEAAERRALHEVELLLEYRKRLIADLVTGHLDVRDAAKRLPEESTEMEALEADKEAAASVEDLEEPIAEEVEA